MFDKLFEDLQTQMGDWVKSSLTELGKQINEKCGVPEPDGDFELWHSFDINQPLISTGCISIEDNAWKIEAYEQEINLNTFDSSDKPIRNVKLFSINEPDRECCVIACRALIKTANMSKTAQLRLGWEREAEFFGQRGGKMTRYYDALVLGSQWKEYEVRHYLKKEQYPATFWIDLDFYQAGIIWIKDIQLFYAPIKSKD